jgi:hypothetical protein
LPTSFTVLPLGKTSYFIQGGKVALPDRIFGPDGAFPVLPLGEAKLMKPGPAFTSCESSIDATENADVIDLFSS